MSISLGVVFGFLAMIFYSLEFFLIKKIKNLQVVSFSITRLLLSSSILFVFTVFIAKLKLPQTITILILLVIGSIGAVAYYFFIKSLSMGQASINVPVANSYVIYTVIIAYIFFDEVVSSYQLGGIILVIAGVILISFKIHEIRKFDIKTIAKGVPYAFLCSLGWGVIVPLYRFVINDVGVFTAVFYMELITLLFMLLFLTKYKFKKTDKNKFFLTILVAIAVAGGFFLGNYGISVGLISIVWTISSAAPLLTVILARIFLKEKIDTNQKIAIFLIVAGLILISL